MASTLDQFLRDGERVIYRTPRPWPPRYRRWHGLTILGIGLGLFALNEWTAFDWGNLAKPAALALLFVLAFSGAVAFAQKWVAEAAVTDRRVLRVSTEGGKLQFRSVDLEEIGKIEVLRRAVRVTKTNGKVVALEHPQHAPEIALAAARAAGRPPPWAPGPKGRITAYIADCAGAAACISALLLQSWAVMAVGLTPIEFPQSLLVIVPVLLVAMGRVARRRAAWPDRPPAVLRSDRDEGLDTVLRLGREGRGQTRQIPMGAPAAPALLQSGRPPARRPVDHAHRRRSRAPWRLNSIRF